MLQTVEGSEKAAVTPTPMASTCRFCENPLRHVVVDLGVSPLANSYLKPAQLNQAEVFYPLKAFVCERCFLVQLEEFATPDAIFSDYAYFSSFSQEFLEHARKYVEMAVPRFQLGANSKVLEIASNDGYLLQYFVERSIPVLGIEPAANVAEEARRRGIPSLVKFFGEATAGELVAEGHAADLVIGNNVFAHVPALNDFVRGLRRVLKPDGVITLEFPHLLQLMRHNQFDTIYHEHFSYFSLSTVLKIFAAHGLRVFDVDEIGTHGGSLRIYGCRKESSAWPEQPRVRDIQNCEEAAGLLRLSTYETFGERVKDTKCSLLDFLITAHRQGKTVVGYGAPAKGNTLLNYCGVRPDLLPYTMDRSPHKQGHFLPGTRIPICAPEKVLETRPDYVLILAWNLKQEIMRQIPQVREWGGQFVVPIPEVKVC